MLSKIMKGTNYPIKFILANVSKNFKAQLFLITFHFKSTHLNMIIFIKYKTYIQHQSYFKFSQLLSIQFQYLFIICKNL